MRVSDRLRQGKRGAQETPEVGDVQVKVVGDRRAKSACKPRRRCGVDGRAREGNV